MTKQELINIYRGCIDILENEPKVGELVECSDNGSIWGKKQFLKIDNTVNYFGVKDEAIRTGLFFTYMRRIPQPTKIYTRKGENIKVTDNGVLVAILINPKQDTIELFVNAGYVELTINQ